MNDDMFNELLASVEQADSIVQGKAAPARITEFAELVGVSKRTFENWEQGRRHPTGPARALLKIVDADPEYALKALHG